MHGDTESKRELLGRTNWYLGMMVEGSKATSTGTYLEPSSTASATCQTRFPAIHHDESNNPLSSEEVKKNDFQSYRHSTLKRKAHVEKFAC